MTCKSYDIPKTLIWEAWLHCLRIDRPTCARSSLARRFDALICRTSRRKNRSRSSAGRSWREASRSRGRRRFRVYADPRIERPRRMIQQLFLPGVDLVRMNLMALRQIAYRRLLPHRRPRDLRLQNRINLPISSSSSAAPSCSIRSRLLPTMPLVPKSGATSIPPSIG